MPASPNRGYTLKEPTSLTSRSDAVGPIVNTGTIHSGGSCRLVEMTPRRTGQVGSKWPPRRRAPFRSEKVGNSVAAVGKELQHQTTKT
jgi:hypothetical protein